MVVHVGPEKSEREWITLREALAVGHGRRRSNLNIFDTDGGGGSFEAFMPNEDWRAVFHADDDRDHESLEVGHPTYEPSRGLTGVGIALDEIGFLDDL